MTFSSAENAELEDKPQRAAPTQCQRGIIQALHHFAVEPVATGRHALQQAQNVEQRALARARRPHQGNELSTAHLQVDAVQHLGLAGPAQVVAFAHVA